MSGEDRCLPEALPVPQVDEFNHAFLTSGELLIQTCRACAAVQHPPGEFCYSCGAMEFDYVETEPRGTISSYTVVHHVTHAALRGAVPYNVVIVELDAHPGLQIVGNLVGAQPGELAIGRPVRGEWTVPLSREGQDDVRLLQWHPVR